MWRGEAVRNSMSDPTTVPSVIVDGYEIDDCEVPELNDYPFTNGSHSDDCETTSKSEKHERLENFSEDGKESSESSENGNTAESSFLETRASVENPSILKGESDSVNPYHADIRVDENHDAMSEADLTIVDDGVNDLEISCDDDDFGNFEGANLFESPCKYAYEEKKSLFDSDAISVENLPAVNCEEDFGDFEVAEDVPEVHELEARTIQVKPIWERVFSEDAACGSLPDAEIKNLNSSGVLSDDFGSVLWDTDKASGFKISWAKSQAWKNLLSSLKMDERDAIAVKQAKHLHDFPAFASSLGSTPLEPQSASMIPVDLKEFSKVEGRSAPEKVEVPPKDFNWVSSEPTNPLSEASRLLLLDLEALGQRSVENDLSPTCTMPLLHIVDESEGSKDFLTGWSTPVERSGSNTASPNGSPKSVPRVYVPSNSPQKWKEMDSLILKIPDLNYMRSKVCAKCFKLLSDDPKDTLHRSEMEIQERKKILKIAREDLRDKKFSSVVSSCRGILEKEPANYTALVLLGAALQDTADYNGAVDAFKKAIEISDDQVTAWQGLRLTYESMQKNSKGLPKLEDHLEVNRKLATMFPTDPSKTADAKSKLVDLLLGADRKEEAIDVLIEAARSAPDDTDWKYNLWFKLVTLLRRSAPAKYEQHLIEGLSYVISKSDSPAESAGKPDLSDYELLLDRLMLSEDYGAVIKQCYISLKVFPNARKPVEMLCKIYVEQWESHGKTLKIQDILTQTKIVSPWVNLARGFAFYDSKRFDKARTALEAGLTQQSCLQGILVYAEVLLELKDHNAAYHILSGPGSDLLSKADNRLVDRFNSLLVESMIATGKQARLKSAKKLMSEDASLKNDISTKIRLSIGLEDWEAAEKLLIDVPDSPEKVLMQFKVLSGLRNFESAMQSLNAFVNDVEIAPRYRVEALICLGEAEVQLDHHDAALTYFLRAAKLDPRDPSAFCRLGHFYLKKNDVDRAKKCFTRAALLSPNDVEVRIALSDCAVKIKDFDEAANILEGICSAFTVEEVEHAWYRLAVVRIHQNRGVDAVQSLQQVIRCDASNWLYWESLGDAYVLRGSYGSAHKAFQTASDLNDKSIYACWACGEMLRMQKEYEQAGEWFKKALEMDAEFLPALVSAGQALLGKAISMKSQILDSRSRDFVEEAFVLVDRALGINGKHITVLKLGGDLCSLCWSMKPGFVVTVPGRIVNQTSRRKTVELVHADVIQLGLSFYLLCAQLAPNRGEVWLDIGKALATKADFESGDRVPIILQALKALKKGLHLNPSIPALWNDLGVLLCRAGLPSYFQVSNEAMAQHCFIQSIKLDSRCSTTWFNLGVFYLVRDQIILSNKAFARAQVCDPDDVNAWVGMAIISEKVGSSNTMDLLRHSAQLDFHGENALNYAKWVMKYVLSPDQKFKKSDEYRMQIEVLYAVPKAFEGLVHYVSRFPENPEAIFALGQLSERLGLLKQAKDSFCAAINLVNSKKVAEIWGSEDALLKKYRFHAGRICFKLGEYSAAVDFFRDEKDANVKNYCWLGLSLLNGKDPVGAQTAFSDALRCVTDQGTAKAQVYSALAIVAFCQEGAESAKMRELLLLGMKSASRNVETLFSACAMGILTSDEELIQAVLKELDQEADVGDRSIFPRVCFFKACWCVLRGDEVAGLRELCRGIHKYPSEGALWSHLALFLLQFAQTKPNAVASSARVAATLNSSDPNALTLATLGYLMAGKPTEAARCAQIACFIAPDTAGNWCALMASLYPSCGNDANKFASCTRILSFLKTYAKSRVDRGVMIPVEESSTKNDIEDCGPTDVSLHLDGEESESHSPRRDSNSSEAQKPFKKRRRKRGRTASQRFNWEENEHSPSPSKPTKDSESIKDGDSGSESSCVEEPEPGEKKEDFKTPLRSAKRKRGKKKVVLRPAEPGAPENSTQFIIDSHVETSGLYYDFSSPSPASRRYEYERHMQESFESEYSSARAMEFEKMTRDELVKKISQLERKENELRRVMESFDPQAMERELHETLISAQRENASLKSKLAEMHANPDLLEVASVSSGSDSEDSSSSSSSSSSSDSSSEREDA
ncbi:unnamed protein product [Notodromas monacha]|uniref:Aftiphilin clathrin-binding box domain-containing protein n=1 Tax=Notodromas monacha TaxID=399045 RepID=A0A7R9BI38_9CRUS|nr:unnamed protein product [Notodromas monacha]CAG0914509.1 unnamed protein product [Notodromas monacha]